MIPSIFVSYFEVSTENKSAVVYVGPGGRCLHLIEQLLSCEVEPEQ